VELGRLLGIIETERAVRVAGSRAHFLKNEGVMLAWAVLRRAIDLLGIEVRGAIATAGHGPSVMALYVVFVGGMTVW